MWALAGPSYSQSLERGLAVLACFTSERAVLRAVDIADELEMSQPTANRYLRTLLALGYVTQDSSHGYRLALRVTGLGMSAQSTTNLREHAHLYIARLRSQSSFTVSLAVLDGTEIVYVDRARSHRPGRDRDDLELHPGSRLPAYCTAMGKILLAHLPAHELNRALVEMQLEAQAPNTVTSKRALREELEIARRDGFAISDRELVAEYRAIAVPVRAHLGEVVAALGITARASTISLENMVAQLVAHMVVTADRISARLGHRRDHEENRE